MKKNFTKLGAMALVGIMGMGLAAVPVSAAAQKTTDVFYTTSATTIDADGKVVMVVPATVGLTKDTTEQTFEVTMQTSDQSKALPENFKAVVKVSSENKGKLKEVKGTDSFDYQLIKGESQGTQVNLKDAEADFNTYTVADDNTKAVEQKATVKVDQASVKGMEKKDPGTQFKDTLTFKVTELKGDGLKPATQPLP